MPAQEEAAAAAAPLMLPLLPLALENAAEATYRRVLARQADNPDAVRGLVGVLAQNNKADEALRIVERMSPTQQEKVGALGRLRATQALGQAKAAAASYKGYLVAWDPVAQKAVWSVEHPYFWNAGVLSTGGGLVFQGTADGHFNAYDAANGKAMWSADTYTATLAGPMTYEVDGEQYVAVGAGFGSVFYLVAGFAVPELGSPDNGRILVYKLGGAATLPKPKLTPVAFPKPPPSTAAPSVVAAGHAKFNRYCLVCHGYNAISGGVLPDLRKTAEIADAGAFKDVVLGGSHQTRGMVSFASVLKADDAERIRQYVISEANQGYAEAHPGGK
jgi:mono/diheme cytochrome c family protein